MKNKDYRAGFQPLSLFLVHLEPNPFGINNKNGDKTPHHHNLGPESSSHKLNDKKRSRQVAGFRFRSSKVPKAFIRPELGQEQLNQPQDST